MTLFDFGIMQNSHPLFRMRISFSTACAWLEQLLLSSGRQVPPEWTVADLVIAVTGSPEGAPVISRYDGLDLLVNGENALLYEQVCEFINFLLGHGVYAGVC